MTDYSYLSHEHCYESENPPCGLKGKHCCLCDICHPQKEPLMSEGMDNLSKLKEVIQKAIPEIMVSCDECNGKGAWAIYAHTGSELCLADDHSDCHGSEQCFKCNGTCQILGRPITLEDCLVAYEKKRGGLDARFIKELTDRYSLGKPLSDQSPECIDFLASLLL